MLMCSTASSWSTSSSTTAPACTMPLATNSLHSSFWYNRPITSVISLRSANLGGLIQQLDLEGGATILSLLPLGRFLFDLRVSSLGVARAKTMSKTGYVDNNE